MQGECNRGSDRFRTRGVSTPGFIYNFEVRRCLERAKSVLSSPVWHLAILDVSFGPFAEQHLQSVYFECLVLEFRFRVLSLSQVHQVQKL
jgi:hypothetical protein